MDTLQPTGTIDVSSIVTNMQAAWVTWAVAFLYGEELTVPGLNIVVALPLLSQIDQEALKLILTAMSNDLVMVAFFLNTAIKKASQAADFTAAVAAQDALPPDATPAQVLFAEQAAMLTFRNLVLLST